MIFSFCQEKNKKLQNERGISFEEIIALIEARKILNIFIHPNQEKYPGQKIYALDIDGYVWLVPFIVNKNEIFLKTAFPSRKQNKSHKGEKNG